MKHLKRSLCLFLTLALLSGCLGLTALADTDYTTGSPWLDPEIVGNVTEDTPIELKDNFALAVNRDVYLAGEIPDGYSYGGTVMARPLALSQEKIALFTEADPSSSHEAEIALNLYNLLLDWDARNAAGMEPILPQLEAVESIDSLSALSSYLTETAPEELLSAFLPAGSDTDLADSSVRALYVAQTDLLLEDADYYLTDSTLASVTREAESKLVCRLLQKAGYEEAEAEALLESCLALEAQLAETCYTSADELSPDYTSRMYNPMTLAEADALCGDYPLAAYLENVGYTADSCIVTNPAFFSAFAEIYTEENLDALKAYLVVHGVVSAASLLDRECYEWVCECRNEINGSTGMRSDEVYASNTVTNSLPWAVSRMYCDTYVTEDDKAEATALINSIVAEYREMLSEETFISAETRENAIGKLDNLEIRCLYPDDWAPYDCSELNIVSAEDGGTLYEASLALSRYLIERDVRLLSEPVERSIWPDGIYPTTLNCFYNPMDNSINIMSAFARGEIFNTDMTVEEVYSRLGTIIGHEVSHAFDSTGAQFDAAGNYSSWWTDEDYAAFQERIERVASYFSSISIWEGQNVVGGNMTGEVCADMGGVTVALRLAAKTENFDYDAFFRSYASLWAECDTPNFAIWHATQDAHPLSYLRCNAVLQQFDEFLDTYGIEEGDGMYLAEADRIRVW